MKLCDVIRQYCIKEYDMRELLNNSNPALSQNQYQKVKKEIRGYVPELEKIKAAAKRAEKACDEALKLLKEDADNVRIDILKEKVHIATQKIGKSLVYEILDIYMSRVVDKYLSGIFVVSDNKLDDEMNVYLSAKVIFQGLQQSVDRLFPYFERAAKEV